MVACQLLGLYKTELIERQGPWKTPEEVELATLEWVQWFNHRRLHSAIGDVTPVEFEEAYRRGGPGLHLGGGDAG